MTTHLLLSHQLQTCSAVARINLSFLFSSFGDGEGEGGGEADGDGHGVNSPAARCRSGDRRSTVPSFVEGPRGGSRDVNLVI